MTEQEKQAFSKELSLKIRKVVIAELSKGELDDISKDRDKINILQAVILFDAPVRLAAEIFGESTSKSLNDMYRLIIKNTK